VGAESVMTVKSSVTVCISGCMCECVVLWIDPYYTTPLGKVDDILRERKLAVQGIYTWLPEFLVHRLYLLAVPYHICRYQNLLVQPIQYFCISRYNVGDGLCLNSY